MSMKSPPLHLPQNNAGLSCCNLSFIGIPVVCILGNLYYRTHGISSAEMVSSVPYLHTPQQTGESTLQPFKVWSSIRPESRFGAIDAAEQSFLSRRNIILAVRRSF